MSEIVLKLVLSAVAIVAAVALSYVSQKYLTKNEQEILEAFIKTAVAASEQLYKGQSKSGELKKAHVISALCQKGFINSTKDGIPQYLDDMIEAAVYELSHK